MRSSCGVSTLNGLSGGHVAFVLFLAFLVPVTPILAEIRIDSPEE